MKRACGVGGLVVVLATGCPGDDGDGIENGTTAVEGSSGEAITTSTSTTSSSTSSSSSSSSSDDPASESGSSADSSGTSSESSGSTSGGESSSSTGTEASPECTLYCGEFLGHCQEIANIEPYDDEADCLATCSGFAHGESGTFAGDTVECRIDHLTFDPDPPAGYYEMHCFHAQEHPTSQCV